MHENEDLKSSIKDILALDVVCGDYAIKSKGDLNNWFIVDVETCYGPKRVLAPRNPREPDYIDLVTRILDFMYDNGCSVKGNEIDILSIGPRSVVAQINDGRVIKVSTLLEEDIIEYKVLGYLTRAGYSNSPKLVCHGLYEGWQIAIVTEGVEGTPLASEIISYAQSAIRGRPVSPGTIRDVGRLLAGLHNVLYKCMDEWCKPEIAGSSRAEKWIDRIRTRARWIAVYSHRLNDPLLSEGALRLLDLAYKVYDPDLLSGRTVFRIHGDLHLYQMYRANNDIMITDFEGEPYKEPGFKNEKEPPERDLAALIRSIDYATVMAIMEKEAIGPKESSEYLSEDLVRWEYMVAQDLIDSYTRALNEELFNVQERLGPSLIFWIIERISYEILYEIRAKTGLYHIPLNAILRMSENRDPILELSRH